jgi:iron(III) transport system substrate-binding protein
MVAARAKGRSMQRRTALAAMLAVAAIPTVRVRAATTLTDRGWLDPKLLAAARAEGSVVVYSSINEEEAAPIWQIFKDATGINVEYVRGSDDALMARILTEARAQRKTWDIVNNTSVSKMSPTLFVPFDATGAKGWPAEMRDPERRWYATEQIYDVPAYNTTHLKPSELPKTYDEFLKHPEWAGHVAINDSDSAWIAGIYRAYGDEKGKALIQALVATLKPALISGHLAVARAVGAGEYWIALNNYISLTMNAKLSGSPTDFWVLNPAAVFFGQVGVGARAPHPNAALLAASFLLGKDAQRQITVRGRLPTRADVPTNPPDVRARFKGKRVIAEELDPTAEDRWSNLYTELVGRASH